MKLGKELFILVFFVGLLVPNLAITQNSIGLNFGFASYEGDLHRYGQEDMNLWNSAGLSFGFYGKKSLGDFFNARLAYQFAQFNGDDRAFAQGTGHIARNFSFVNNLHEVTMKLDIEPFKNWRISPFTTVGAGLAYNNPGTVFDLDNKSNEQIARINEDQTDLPRFIMAVPIGVGFNVKLTEKLAIGSELGMRLPVSDYLDGVSSSAESNFNDYFGTGVISLTYNFGKAKSTKAPVLINKDQNLSEQMIHEHPPSGDSGENAPTKLPDQKKQKN